MKASTGFLADVDKQMFEAAQLGSCKSYLKLVIILLDEMHLREDLVYDKNSGCVVGFANLGEVNNHLLELEHTLERNCEEKAMAKSLLVIIVKGLFSSLRFPYAMFPCDKVTGDLLFQPFWLAIFRFERMGFTVCCKQNHCIYI